MCLRWVHVRLVENALVDAKADPCLRWSHIHLVGNAVVQIKLIKSMDIPNKIFIEIYIMLSCFLFLFQICLIKNADFFSGIVRSVVLQ